MYMCICPKRIYLQNGYFHCSNFGNSFRSSSSYKNTLYLPKTRFPHKVNPVSRLERDVFIEKKANFESLYEWQLQHNKSGEFVLHDGPPYANGAVHIGHAVNKILKDITLRWNLINGRKINFVPGWDCHGLPIELKVLKETKENLKALDVRQKAFEFSQQAKETQLSSFKRWGLVADWSNCYITCHPSYVTKQLNVFQHLYEKGIIFQDFKPVYWSPWNQTSLAEAELEYNENHISKSVYLKLLVIRCPDHIKSRVKSPSLKLHLLIWTTTPWSLPANQAVCYSANKRYSIVFAETHEEYYLIAQEMISELENVMKMKFEHIDDFEGTVLQAMTYRHPVYIDRECPLLSAHHVTMTKGTGLVHMAPNHGFDDFVVAQHHNLPIDPCLVDDKGSFVKVAGEKLTGLNVFSCGSNSILELLKDSVVFQNDYSHSYPYDWRSNKPVIIRCSRQWFIDVKKIKDTAIRCLKKVKVIPEDLRKGFLNQLDSSPQWCISRQRSWGVPIPAFYNEEGNKHFVHREITKHLCELIQKKGIHAWWELPMQELLPKHLKIKCDLQEDGLLSKGEDIMDIWLDSGISWMNALKDSQVADVCIEGIDQIRGWFNSSLLTSVATRECAPYKKLFLHGFTTDASGCKMSKSKGNVVSPSDITDGCKKMKLPALGIDTLRWWVAAHACHHENIPLKTEILEECAQNLNKFRNIFKFLLGSLNPFDADTSLVKTVNMRPLDLFMLHNLHKFSSKINLAFDAMQYKNVTKDILNFVTNDVSAFYCQLIKDRLYSDEQYSQERLSCQTVLFFILNTLAQVIAPIMPHLAEEIFLHHPKPEFVNCGVFRSHLPSLVEFLGDTNIPESVVCASDVREKILKAEMKLSNMDVFIIGSPKLLHHLECLNLNTQRSRNVGLLEFFQAANVFLGSEAPQSVLPSSVTLEASLLLPEGSKEHYTVILQDTQLQKCPRCRLYSSVDSFTLCDRCLSVTSKIPDKCMELKT